MHTIRFFEGFSTVVAQTQSRRRRHSWFYAPLQLLQRLAAVLKVWHVRAQARRQLLALDDRMLRDIGIDRATAQDVGQRPFWKE